jgi:D-amino-acid dehydrogenase
MRVLVMGAGVVGATAAWYLTADGHEVTLVDRQSAPALETSFANGGQISAAHAEPWADPGAPAQILRWLGRDDAPLLFRPRLDANQWRWALQFLVECLPWRNRRNTEQCMNLAIYSRECLRALRAATGLRYDQLERGILEFYTDAKEFDHGVAKAALMRRFGCDRDVKTPTECVAIEPALAPCAHRLAGGIYTAGDESGDAQQFTDGLVRLAAGRGLVFRGGVTVEAIAVAAGRVEGVRCADAQGRCETLAADAYVVALGSYSPLLLRPLRVPAPVYPLKGYSATLDVGDARGAPTVSLTDLASRIVISRLGRRLRIAGTAELADYDTALDPVRCEALVARIFDLMPECADRRSAQFWAGLRPATPSNVPLLGRTRYPNLFLDTGHGTLGWTLACGSGRALADLVSGRRPDVDFAFTA